jgi:hypothetical protein
VSCECTVVSFLRNSSGSSELLRDDHLVCNHDLGLSFCNLAQGGFTDVQTVPFLARCVRTIADQKVNAQSISIGGVGRCDVLVWLSRQLQ